MSERKFGHSRSHKGHSSNANVSPTSVRHMSILIGRRGQGAR